MNVQFLFEALKSGDCVKLIFLEISPVEVPSFRYSVKKWFAATHGKKLCIFFFFFFFFLPHVRPEMAFLDGTGIRKLFRWAYIYIQCWNRNNIGT